MDQELIKRLFPLATKSTLARNAPNLSARPPEQSAIVTAPPSERRIRQSQKPKMNKLETEALAWLQNTYPGNEFKPQAKRYELATGHWYKPDFTTAGKSFSTETAFEVKGPHAFRGGFENLKVAARVWPECRWILVWKEPGSGEWRQQTILP